MKVGGALMLALCQQRLAHTPKLIGKKELGEFWEGKIWNGWSMERKRK